MFREAQGLPTDRYDFDPKVAGLYRITIEGSFAQLVHNSHMIDSKNPYDSVEYADIGDSLEHKCYLLIFEDKCPVETKFRTYLARFVADYEPEDVRAAMGRYYLSSTTRSEPRGACISSREQASLPLDTLTRCCSSETADVGFSGNFKFLLHSL